MGRFLWALRSRWTFVRRSTRATDDLREIPPPKRPHCCSLHVLLFMFDVSVLQLRLGNQVGLGGLVRPRRRRIAFVHHCSCPTDDVRKLAMTELARPGSLHLDWLSFSEPVCQIDINQSMTNNA